MSKSDAELEAGIVSNVDQYGCSIMFVFDPDEGKADFAYSIGFPKSLAQPEVIVFGLSRSLMLSMINETHRQCAEEELKLQDGVVIGDLLEGFDCIVREVPKDRIESEYFGSAMWYRQAIMGEEMDRAFQIFWPGAATGLFPWDASADPEIVGPQSELLEELRT